MEFRDFSSAVDSLATMPTLKSLYITLNEEEQVDLIMKKMVSLEFLNGLPVEREEDFQFTHEVEPILETSSEHSNSTTLHKSLS